MATNTPKLNLVKPDMADFADIRVLNQNMDILDREVGGLDYVKNVVKSDSGLTFTKKDDTEIQVPLNYMPTTGGNFTGDITIRNNQVVYIVDKIVSDNQTSIKYADGTLVQYANIDSPKTENTILTLTFQVPFIDANYYVLTTPRDGKYITDESSVNTANDTNTYVSDYQKTTTSCKIACDDYATGVNVLLIGRWKA